MQRQALWNRLYLSGIDGRAADLARENGLGLEIAAFCYAPNLEDPAVLSAVRADMAGLHRFWLHAPFAELCPCAIDPLVRQVTARRYRQAIALTLLYSRQLWDSNYSVKTTAMANNPNVSTRIATQFLIYEIVTGLRDADTFNRRGSNGYTSGDVFYNAGVASVSGFAEKYNSIVSSVQNAMKIPSFTSRSSGSAPTVTMSGSQVSVTDSNGVLGNFSFTNGNGA